MEEINKRIELLQDELTRLVMLKSEYEQNPMKYLESEISYMRAQKHITNQQIINTVINYVKTHGFD
jgi:hypothetical protein